MAITKITRTFDSRIITFNTDQYSIESLPAAYSETDLISFFNNNATIVGDYTVELSVISDGFTSSGRHSTWYLPTATFDMSLTF